MQTLPNRARIVFVAVLVVLSAGLVIPAASGETADTYAQQQADDEPNDDVENATVADTSRAINGEISSEGDVDYYAIDLRENSQIEISQGIGGGALPVTLLDREGEVLGRIADQDSFEGEEDLLRANASDTGTYYLRVEGDPGEEYSIGTTITEPDEYESNDDIASATEIESGERIAGTVVRGDRDVFAIDTDAGEEIDVVGDATAAAQVTVYGPDEDELADEALPSPGGEFESEQGYGVPVVTATAEESGTYYVAVAIEENTIGNVNGPYNLTVTTSGDSESGSAAENATTTDESSGDTTDTTETRSSTSSAESTADDAPEGDSSSDADSGETTTTATQTANAKETTTNESTENGQNDATTTAGSETTANAETTATVENTTATPGTEATRDAPGTGTATGGNGDVSENVEETAVSGPGFGIVAAIAALLGAALLAIRRN